MRPQAHSPEPNLPGLVFDSRRRTQYNYFRDCDPAIGRYVQSDPIGLKGGTNTYGYVDGNPLGKSDRYGLADDENGTCGDQTCPKCEQGFMDCLANCIRTHDPLNNLEKTALTAGGGTGFKSWGGLRTGMGGASRLMTFPSWIGHQIGGPAGKGFRFVGRLCSPVWVSYGVYLAGMETYCAGKCASNSCAY